MPEPKRLLAKSRSRDGRELRVDEHCLDTANASGRVFSGRILEAWLRFFRLQDGPRFLRDLRIACLFHDLGKANEHFLRAVERPGSPAQVIRHEHLSALVICLPVVRDWLGQNRDLDFDAIAAAVLSHHAKASEDSKNHWFWASQDGAHPIALYLRHDETKAILWAIAAEAGLSSIPELPADPWPAPVWDEAWSWGCDRATDLSTDLPNGFNPRRNHLLAVKAATIVADAVASGLWREDRDLDAFLAATLHQPAITGDEVWAKVIDQRVDQLTRAGRWQQWSSFQTAADGLGSRAAIVAACGAGKTLAAWRWIAAMAKERPIGSAIFLYPTRATATEGFKDYVAFAPESEAKLLTGTAKMDLPGLFTNPTEALKNKRLEDYESEDDARLFALANWSKRYFSATLDQFLSFLEHGYSGLCLLPQLADAAIVIDEVHSLDRHLFDRLVAFLTHFDVPVLLMSATVPSHYRRSLVELGVRIYPDDSERVDLDDLRQEEERARYRIVRASGRDDSLTRIQASDAILKRSTLWVVNTVRRCQELAKLLRNQHGIQPLVYHSRFTPRDRRERHAAVIAAFQPRQDAGADAAPIWAITTQVCEMSLDLDADRLVSEDAPLPAIIQRLGRTCRKRISHDPAEVAAGRARDPEFRSEVILYPGADSRPYSLDDGGTEQMAGAARFAQDFNAREIGQHHLAEALNRKDGRFAAAQAQPQGASGFVSGGWFAVAQPLRGEDDHRDVRCVLSTYLERGLGPSGMPGFPDDPLDAWIISVPRRFVLPDEPPLPPWLAKLRLRIADGTRYSPELGFDLTEIDHG